MSDTLPVLLGRRVAVTAGERSEHMYEVGIYCEGRVSKLLDVRVSEMDLL